MARFQFPPDDPADAGPLHRSRFYEQFVNLIPVFTYATLLWCAVVFITLWQIDKTDYHTLSKMMAYFGATRDSLHTEGQWWVMITSAFIHYDLLHFLFNMYWLVTLGTLMERGIGSVKTALFFITAAFVSSTYQLQIGGYGIGFSGVVYAIAGFIWGAWPRYTGFLEKFNGKTLRWFFLWQALCFVLSSGGMIAIGNTAHISGMIYGFLLGMWAHKGSKNGWYWLLGAIIMMIGAVGILDSLLSI